MTFKDKIVSRKVAASLVNAARDSGRIVGFTSGVFDLLHPGHAAYLETAKSKVDLLLVGINSDASVKANKGPARPICSQDQRAAMLAALSSIDTVFIFDEQNNHANISELKPHIYFKAGDYSDSNLTSKPIVESYGGSVEIIPFEEGFSSSSIIERTLAAYPQAPTQEGARIHRESAPAVFVDRDGTMIDEVDYLADPEGVRPFPGALKAIKELRDRGFRIVVVTNQPGIGLGYLTRQDFLRVNSRLFMLASKEGALFDRICFCPHSKSDACTCRKPSTGLISEVVRDLNLDLARSWVVGDMTTDIQLAQNLGCSSILVKTGKGGKDEQYDVTPTTTVDSLVDAARTILETTELPANNDLGTRSISGFGSETVSLEQIGRYSAFIGHDFNNILGSIRGCIDLIRQKLGARGEQHDHPLDRPLRILEAATERGLELTQKLGGFARPDQEQHPVDLQICLNCVVELLTKTNRPPDVKIDLRCPEGVLVWATEVVLTQMILQLLKNAIDSMQHLPERTVIVMVETQNFGEEASSLDLKRGEYARVTIVDHGKGIREDLQEVVFTPFYSTKGRRIGKGLGLSLSMARVIMRQHGGTLLLASKPNVGTSISLLFPVYRSAEGNASK